MRKAIASQTMNVMTAVSAPRVRRVMSRYGMKMSGVSFMAAASPVAIPSGNVREPILRSDARSQVMMETKNKIDLAETNGIENRVQRQCR